VQNKSKYIAEIFKSIGHPIRVEIIRTIYEHETLSVGQIQNLLHKPQPIISLHLGILRKKGIINAVKKGKNSFYFINNKSIPQIIQILYYDSN